MFIRGKNCILRSLRRSDIWLNGNSNWVPTGHLGPVFRRCRKELETFRDLFHQSGILTSPGFGVDDRKTAHSVAVLTGSEIKAASVRVAAYQNELALGYARLR